MRKSERAARERFMKRITTEELNRVKLMKFGRRSFFKAYMLDEGYKLGALGLTLDEIAAFWNVNVLTLRRWCEKCPEFRANINKGRDEADATVVKALLDSARSGNVTAMIFWLKNRHPKKWRDVHDFRGEGFGNDRPVQIVRNVIFTSVPPNPDGGSPDLHATEGAGGSVREGAV